MTTQAAEATISPLSDETSKFFETWLAVDGPVALRLRQRLFPVEADENGRGIIFPPTYADIGYNIDTLADGTRVATIDTVGSQANRLESIFKSTGKNDKGEELNSLASLVPQIEIVLPKTGGKKGGKKLAQTQGDADVAEHIEKRSLLDLAHRSADAVVLSCPTLAPEIAKAFEALRNKGNAASLCAIAPTSLVFGVWDSRGGSGEKRPRLVRSLIRAWDVEVLHSAAQFNSVWKALNEDAKKELTAEEKKKGKLELSAVGLKDAPATFRKTDKIPQFVGGAPNPEARVLGGVLAKGAIERDVTINLVALRGLRGKDDKETKEVQQYLLSLALLAATVDLELFLREGCLLRYADEKDEWKTVPRRGEPRPIEIFPSLSQLTEHAQAAALLFKSKWPNGLKEQGKPVLEHEFNIEEAKKLLAKKDGDAPADALG